MWGSEPNSTQRRNSLLPGPWPTAAWHTRDGLHAAERLGKQIWCWSHSPPEAGQACSLNLAESAKAKYQHYPWNLQSYGEGNGTPLQYSCLENPMGGGAWWAAVHGVAKSRTRLSGFTFSFHFHALEKEMATHSSVLAWRIPGTGEPGGLLSMGLHRVGHDWSDLAAQSYNILYVQDIIQNYWEYKETEKFQVLWEKTINRCQYWDDPDIEIIGQSL